MAKNQNQAEMYGLLHEYTKLVRSLVDLKKEEKGIPSEKIINLLDLMFERQNSVRNSEKDDFECDKNVVIVGNSGVGKSTITNVLMGNKVLAETDEDDDEEFFYKLAEDSNGPKIGDTISAETTELKSWVNEEAKIKFYDCPGFEDNRGGIFQIENALLISDSINNLKDSTFLFLEKNEVISNKKDTRLEGLRSFFKSIKHFFGSFENIKTYQDSILVVFTKGDSGYNYIKRAKVVLKKLEKINNLEDYEEFKEFIKLIAEKNIKVTEFAKAEEEGILPQEILEGLLKSINNCKTVDNVKVKIGDLVSADTLEEYATIGEVINDYAVEMMNKFNKQLTERFNETMRSLQKIDDIKQQVSKVVELINDSFEKLTTTNFMEFIKAVGKFTKLASYKDSAANVETLDHESVFNKIISAIDYINKLNSNVQCKLTQWFQNTVTLSHKYDFLLKDVDPVITEDQGMIMESLIISTKNIKYHFERAKQVKYIVSNSFLFLVEDDLDLTGVDLSIFAHKWHLLGPRVINCSGKHGEMGVELQETQIVKSVIKGKPADKGVVADMSFDNGRGQDGKHGLAGENGEHGGDIFAYSFKVRGFNQYIENNTYRPSLTFVSKGGNGAKGQKGGDGSKGIDGAFSISHFKEQEERLYEEKEVLKNKKIKIDSIVDSLKEEYNFLNVSSSSVEDNLTQNEEKKIDNLVVSKTKSAESISMSRIKNSPKQKKLFRDSDEEGKGTISLDSQKSGKFRSDSDLADDNKIRRVSFSNQSNLEDDLMDINKKIKISTMNPRKAVEFASSPVNKNYIRKDLVLDKEVSLLRNAGIADLLENYKQILDLKKQMDHFGDSTEETESSKITIPSPRALVTNIARKFVQNSPINQELQKLMSLKYKAQFVGDELRSLDKWLDNQEVMEYDLLDKNVSCVEFELGDLICDKNGELPIIYKLRKVSEDYEQARKLVEKIEKLVEGFIKANTEFENSLERLNNKEEVMDANLKKLDRLTDALCSDEQDKKKLREFVKISTDFKSAWHHKSISEDILQKALAVKANFISYKDSYNAKEGGRLLKKFKNFDENYKTQLENRSNKSLKILKNSKDILEKKLDKVKALHQEVHRLAKLLKENPHKKHESKELFSNLQKLYKHLSPGFDWKKDLSVQNLVKIVVQQEPSLCAKFVNSLSISIKSCKEKIIFEEAKARDLFGEGEEGKMGCFSKYFGSLEIYSQCKASFKEKMVQLKNEFSENKDLLNHLEDLYKAYKNLTESRTELIKSIEKESDIAKELLWNEGFLVTRKEHDFSNRDAVEKLAFILRYVTTANKQFYERYVIDGPEGKAGGRFGIGGDGGYGGKAGTVKVKFCDFTPTKIEIADGIKGENGENGENGLGGKNVFSLEGLYYEDKVWANIRGVKEKFTNQSLEDTIDTDQSNKGKAIIEGVSSVVSFGLKPLFGAFVSALTKGWKYGPFLTDKGYGPSGCGEELSVSLRKKALPLKEKVKHLNFYQEGESYKDFVQNNLDLIFNIFSEDVEDVIGQTSLKEVLIGDYSLSADILLN